MGTYFIQTGRKEFKKSTIFHIALMGQKMISFGTVMTTVCALLLMTMTKRVVNEML
jgi:hypothetical protein